jgi:RHS repeat-associated protein
VFVYPLYDAHGNMVRTLSKTTNGYTVSAETVVDPWGTKVSSGTGEKRDYCASIGHVTDDESGMVYMRARYYEPGMGRFVSQDNHLEGLNWYIYAENDPLSKVDISGNSIILLCVIGMFVGYFAALGMDLLENQVTFKSFATAIPDGLVGAVTAAAVKYLKVFLAKYVLSGALRPGYHDAALGAAGLGAIAALYYGKMAGEALYQLFMMHCEENSDGLRHMSPGRRWPL